MNGKVMGVQGDEGLDRSSGSEWSCAETDAVGLTGEVGGVGVDTLPPHPAPGWSCSITCVREIPSV